MIPDGARNADRTRRANLLETGRHIDAVPVDLGPVDLGPFGERIRDVDAEAETDPQLRRADGFLSRDDVLKGDGEANGLADARERDETGVPGGIDEPAFEAGD